MGDPLHRSGGRPEELTHPSSGTSDHGEANPRDRDRPGGRALREKFHRDQPRNVRLPAGNLPQGLCEVGAGLLLKGSEAESVWPWFAESVRYIADHVLNASVREVLDAGHMEAWVEPQSCADKLVRFLESSPDGVVVRDSAGVRIIENPGQVWSESEQWRLSPEPVLQIGAVDGDPPHLFSRITTIAPLADGRIVVADAGSRTLGWFAAEGTFLFQRGGPGQGPGEFGSPASLTFGAGDTLVAWDAAIRRATTFGCRRTSRCLRPPQTGSTAAGPTS